MTPADLYQYLTDRGVRLTPKPDGGIHVRAPVGVVTPDLREAMHACKPALWVLAQPPQQGDFLPWPLFRYWVTGSAPQNGSAVVGAPLPPPTVHDVPSTARTFVGQRCSYKKCPPNAHTPSGHPASLRYQRTGLCVACLERLKNERN